MIGQALRRHVLLLAVVVGAVALLWLSAGLQAAFVEALESGEAFAERHPLASRAAFVVLAAVSAILMFFSSVALVPVAVHAWGAGQTVVLLLLGWFLGGHLAYAIGRFLGRRVAEHFVAARDLDRCADLLSVRMSVVEVALVKTLLPAEAPSIVLGVLRYPYLKLVPVLLLSELPFALWSVYLGQALVEDRRLAFVLMLLAGGAAFALIVRRVGRRI
jgi:uncharacterized membrane protein YdjX (TVP38/TMEM64 family)